MRAATLPDVDLGVNLDDEVECANPVCSRVATWSATEHHDDDGAACQTYPICEPCRAGYTERPRRLVQLVCMRHRRHAHVTWRSL